MSEINSIGRTSGTGGTAAVRALDKSRPTNTKQDGVREARVAELKQQYQSGLYVVDSVQLASAIVRDVLNSKR